MLEALRDAMASAGLVGMVPTNLGPESVCIGNGTIGHTCDSGVGAGPCRGGDYSSSNACLDSAWGQECKGSGTKGAQCTPSDKAYQCTPSWVDVICVSGATGAAC